MSAAAKILAVGASCAMLAAIAAGLAVIGLPDVQRARAFDDRRANDLNALQRDLTLYRNRHKALPESLTVLAQEPGLHPRGNDPRSGVAYEYRVLDAAAFELCAAFAQESREQGTFVLDQWRHGAGRQCFQRTMHGDADGAHVTFE